MTASFHNPQSEIRNQPDLWFMGLIKEIVNFEEELAGVKN